MRKALFVPYEEKKDEQVRQESAMTKQERIEKMFELIDLCLATSKQQYLKSLGKDRFIVLRRNVRLSKGSL